MANAVRHAGVVMATLLAVNNLPAQVPTLAHASIEIDEPAPWRASVAATVKAEPNRSLYISGLARFPGGIVDVLINGDRAAMEPVAGGVRFTGYAAVTPSTRAVIVTATTALGSRISETYRVDPQPDSVAATPQQRWDVTSGGFRGRRWAVIVGISQYQDPRVQQLRYADRDAKAMYDFLRSARAGLGGIPADHIQFLTNRYATYRGLRTALFSFLKQATEEDVVYIYFAGHGAPDPDRPDNLYLLPYDFDPANVAGTALPMEDVNTAIRKILARHIVVITDACHSAGVAGQLGKRGGLNRINDAFLHDIRSSGNVNVIFTSSEADQLSQEGTRWGGGHGVFTYSLLQGLLGAADEDHDQVVSLGELLEWTRSQVRRETGNAQIPSISQTAYDRRWPMGEVLPDSVPVIAEAEVQKYMPVMSAMSSLYDQPWGHPDSLVSFVGVPDTIRITVDSITREALDPTLVKWASSNPDVAAVDSGGIVHPLQPGLAEVTATGFGKRTVMPVRVFAYPTFVRYTPGDSVLKLVTGSGLRVTADLLLPNGQWLRGLSPPVATGDPLVLAPDAPHAGFIALREGETDLVSRIAGQPQRWRVKVKAAPIHILVVSSAIAVDDSIELAAETLGSDGQARGRATSIAWRTSDARTAGVRDAMLYGRSVGKVTLFASRGLVEDSLTLFVMGDLVAAMDSAGKHWIRSVSLHRGEVLPPGPAPLDGDEPALSPNGREIAFVSSRETGFPRIYLADADGSNIRRVTPQLRGKLGLPLYREIGPAWTGDGERLVFASDISGSYQIYSVARSGGDLRRLTTGRGQYWNPSVAVDVPALAYEQSRGAGQADLVAALANGAEARQIGPAYREGRPSIRRPHLLPGAERLICVQTDPGQYGAGDLLMLLDARTGATLRVLVRPRSHERISYAVSPDGSRIAYLQYPRLAPGGNVLTVIDMEGKILSSLRLGPRQLLHDITWGAGRAYEAEGPR